MQKADICVLYGLFDWWVIFIRIYLKRFLISPILDFNKDTFSAHVQCMSEEQRYSGKDYVPKANQNKGQRKQEAWVDMVRGITEKKANISKGVKDILTKISAYDNIPRKKAKFLNFMKNSFRYMKVNELEEAWVLLEEAINETKKSPEGNQKPEDPKPEMNGKRKLEVTESTEEPVQKKKKKSKDPEDQDQENDQEVSSTTTDSKFKWQDAIKNILSAKNNEIKLKKLKKKVLKQYQSFTGITAVGDKIENKFNKKIAKLKGVVVDNDRVRLVEAWIWPFFDWFEIK